MELTAPGLSGKYVYSPAKVSVHKVVYLSVYKHWVIQCAFLFVGVYEHEWVWVRGIPEIKLRVFHMRAMCE